MSYIWGWGKGLLRDNKCLQYVSKEPAKKEKWGLEAWLKLYSTWFASAKP
jgi:hypothetical protein